MTDENAAPEAERPRLEPTTELVGKKILAAIVDTLRGEKKGFAMMNEGQQEGIIRRLEVEIRAAVVQGFAVMVAGEFPNAVATLEKVSFSAKGVQGTLSLGAAHEHRHDLADYAGRPVLVILASAEKYLERMNEIRGQADQPQLNLDVDNTSGFDGERHDPGAGDPPAGDDDDRSRIDGDGGGEALPPADDTEKTGEGVDPHPGEFTREAVIDALATIGMTVGDEDDVLADAVNTWDQATRKLVLDWAWAEHLHKFDSTVHVPPRPSVIQDSENEEE